MMHHDLVRAPDVPSHLHAYILTREQYDMQSRTRFLQLLEADCLW